MLAKVEPALERKRLLAQVGLYPTAELAALQEQLSRVSVPTGQLTAAVAVLVAVMVLLRERFPLPFVQLARLPVGRLPLVELPPQAFVCLPWWVLRPEPPLLLGLVPLRVLPLVSAPWEFLPLGLAPRQVPLPPFARLVQE